jgi:tetratricopeptide (TPR) repeat protein
MKKRDSSRAEKLNNDRDSKPVTNSEGDQSFSKVLSESRALFLVIAATVLVYANSLSGAFVFDDTKQIVNNAALRSWGNIFRAFTSDVWSFQRATLNTDIPPPYYRPLFTVYLTVNYQLFGLWEPGWHLVNLFIHVGVTVLVYYFLRRISREQFVALIGAVLFGLHPVHVESVSWISGIPDPLAALFYLPSLIWYVRYRQEGDRKWLIASVAAYGLSVLCKETPLVLPLILIVWELVQRGDTFAYRLKTAVVRAIPYGVVAVAYVIVRFSVLGSINWQHPLMANVPRLSIWLTVPLVIVEYFQHLIAPFQLSLIYSPPLVHTLSDWRFLVAIAALIGLAVMLWVYRKAISAEVWFGIALIVINLIPVLNIRVFHYEYIIQDRYLYLPSIGFCFLVALGLAQMFRKNTSLAWGFVGIIVIAFGASTILQNRVWKDSVSLWQRAVEKSPNSKSTHYNLGLAYLGIKQFDRAVPEMLEAKRLDSSNPSVYNNLAMAQAGVGKLDDAIANVETALKLDPRSPEAHNNLGALLYDKKDYAGSKREFLLVLERDPNASSARFNLARTLAALADYPGAIREFEAVLRQNPADIAARYELGSSYAAVGRKAEAIAQFDRALSADRDGERVTQMRHKLEQLQSQ